MSADKRLDKKELVRLVAERLELNQNETEAVIDATLDEIYNSVARGEPVTLRNFGTFYVEAKRDAWLFKFTPSQKWRKLFGWHSTYKGEL